MVLRLECEVNFRLKCEVWFKVGVLGLRLIGSGIVSKDGKVNVIDR